MDSPPPPTSQSQDFPTLPDSPDTQEVGGQRQANTPHTRGHIRKVSKGATPPSYLYGSVGAFVGICLLLSGITMVAIGFSTTGGSSVGLLRFGGAVFLVIGGITTIAGCIYFTIVYGRHAGEHNKMLSDDGPPSGAGAATGPHWANRQMPSPRSRKEYDSKIVRLFQTCDTTNTQQGTNQTEQLEKQYSFICGERIEPRIESV